jgi:hypothetical protein
VLVAFLDRISGFVDRRFMVAFWAPCFLFAAGGLGILGLVRGEASTLIDWWEAQGGSSQALAAFGFLLANTVGAYLLQAFASPLVRLYEGYWPGWMVHLIHWSQVTMRSSMGSIGVSGESVKSLADDQVDHQRVFRRYVRFPYSAERIRPTRLGNVLTAAEEYAYEMYRLDTVLWWPRLIPLLPDLVRSQIDAALTPLLALLNLSTLFLLLTVVALSSGLYEMNIVLFLGGSLACLAISRLCYTAAVVQGSDYGQQIRVAFDLYRVEILRQMRLPVPENHREEAALWDSLNKWIYYYSPPPENDWPPDPEILKGGFQYDSGKPGQSQPLKIDVTVSPGKTG